MIFFRADSLLDRSDEEFVHGLFDTLLRRPADEDGFNAYVSLIRGRPELRAEAVRRIVESAEARDKRVVVAFGEEQAAAVPAQAAGPTAIDADALDDKLNAIRRSLENGLSQLRFEVGLLREAIEAKQP